MLLSKTVTICWNPKNRKWYENKGYVFTKWKDKFEVKVEDLTNTTHTKVEVKCDACGELLDIQYVNYIKCTKENNKNYCKKCSDNGYKKWESFYDWCYKNLVKNEADRILSRWDYKLNKCSYKDISYGTNEKYYFKCPRGLHKSELKDINNFTSNQGGNINCSQCNSFAQWGIDNLDEDFLDKYWDLKKNNELNVNPWKISKGNCNKKIWIKCQEKNHHGSYLTICNSFYRGSRCPICSNSKIIKGINDIATTHPYLVKYFTYKSDSEKYSYGSNEKISVKCPDCGFQKDLIIHDFIMYGFRCPKCGDGISYPEKFMFNMLEQLNIEFIPQLNKSNLGWCCNFRYDFYIPSIDCIVETHGIQHYKNINWGTRYNKQRTLKEEQKNDRLKEILAKENGIKHYIVIDCRKSELEFIKNNILNSELAELFDLTLINWLEVHKFALTNLVKSACNLWSEGIKNTKEIAKRLNLSTNTISRYLTQGSVANFCDYDGEYIHKQTLISMSKSNEKKVICLNTLLVFNKIKDAKEYYKINGNSIISDVCLNKRKSAGKHPITGEPLKWMFYDEYIKQQEQIHSKKTCSEAN